jgi:serine/threonine-protein kinase HipA
MLEQIGGECAGAVTFIPEGQQPPESAYHYRKLDAKELAGILRDLPKRPLLAGEKGIRLSLAGAQDKVAVRIEGEEVSLPLGGAPSTHILKPAVERFAGVVSNEALCMTLAAHINLPAAKVETRRVEDVEYLLVERYDRKHVTVDGAPTVERLHQEDFCQAQNIVSEMKYQKEGGPSFKQCLALLRNVSTAPVLDLANLLDAAIFNYLVGNNDPHGKNFSLVYQDKQIRLAPLYDVDLHDLLFRAEQRHGNEDWPRIFIRESRAEGFRGTGGGWGPCQAIGPPPGSRTGDGSSRSFR